ncbi:MAG: C4-dicarboxylate transporter DctA [Telmatospirillum sp.]|nr:C4-dicarboxylate transporter DctA [Telmatospirillum sp.]
MQKKPFYRNMTFQMLLAIILGVVVGLYYPQTGTALNPLAIGFVKLIKMIVGLIIFTTVTVGIAKMGNFKEVGRIGIRSLVYFEVVSTLALVFGLIAADLLQPGAGMNINPTAIDTSGVASIEAGAKSLNTVDFLLNIIPSTAIGAFTQGNILQVLLLALFFGFALGHLKDRGKPVVDLLERIAELIFLIVGAIMKVAPLAVFGAIAFTIGKFGVGSLVSLGKMVGTIYLTCILFMLVVMGAVARATGFSFLKFLRYIKEEIVLVFATASSEAGLPRLMAKLEKAGCAKPVVGFTVPTGYSFNLDGSSIYLTVAALFIAQATNTHLTLTQQITLLAVFLLTSKGVAGVTAAGFVTLAATLTMLPDIPMAGLALLLGIDRFCDAMRSATNLIGNGVATLAIAKWENARDDAQMNAMLNGEGEDAPAA